MSEAVESTTESPAKSFGLEIKAAREARGWSQTALAQKLCCGQPYVSKVESGQQLASSQFAEQCDKVFGTPGTYARMRQRAADAGNPVWFIPYLQLEREASAIDDYSPTLVAGILQTPEYAEAVYRSARPEDTTDQIKAQVEKRMRRREVFDTLNPPSLWVVLHESALRTDVGGANVMREQLRHLVAATESPYITIQIFPFSAGTPARATPFKVLTRQDGSKVLYEETYERGQVDDSAEAVAAAQAAYDRLRADALSRDESLALIQRAMKEYTHEHHPRPLRRGVGQEQLQPGERRRLPRMGPRVRSLRRRPRS